MVFLLGIDFVHLSMSNKKYIDDNFDLEGLKHIGLLENITDYDYIEKRIVTYFGFEYIQQYSEEREFGKPRQKFYLKAENIFSDN